MMNGEDIMKKGKHMPIVSLLLAASLVLPLITDTSALAAKSAKAPKLSLTKISALESGSSKKVQVKKNGVKKLVKVTWKTSSKAIAKLSKTKGNSTVIKAGKAGKATITATTKYKVKAKSKTLTQKLKCTVNVTAAVSDQIKPTSTSTTTATATAAPTATTPVYTKAPITYPTQTPGATIDPLHTADPSVTAGPTNLLSALSKYVKNVGTCIAYGNSWGGDASTVADAETTAFIKENYNSLTAENEMKPESILGYQANTIKTSEAASKGYEVPADYKETICPTFNYSKIDTLMKYAYDNKIRIRYHGLLWHEQTSNWFFREDYDTSKPYVTPEVMDARIEYYIKNVMNHVYQSQYKDVVYCWDVVNEFYHMTECISRIKGGPMDTPENAASEDPINIDKNDNVKCYYEVYGKEIFEDPTTPWISHVKTNPAYVKKAFKWAHEVLEKYGKVDTVELVYNDYDTNYPDVRASILAITKFINTKDELNPDGDKLVTTVGMQTHDKLSEKYTIESHEETMSAIRESGLNLQVTEMDLNMNAKKGHTLSEQLKYWEDFITLIIKETRLGANFTGLTWWGIKDSSSWLGSEGSPLLCGNSVKDKKEAYYTVIKTAYKY